MTDQKMIAHVEYGGCAFSIKFQLGTKQKGAFIEGVHLCRVDYSVVKGKRNRLRKSIWDYFTKVSASNNNKGPAYF